MADSPDNAVLKGTRDMANIREIKREDLPALKAIIESVGLFPSEMLDDMTANFIAGNESAELWLTLENDGHIAIAYVAPERLTDGTWNLLLIAVASRCQGQGFGTTLLAHIEQTLRRQGHRILLVETSGLPEFERTRQFYRQAGYIEEARIREFYKAGEDKIVFWKAIN
jgi:ribosomal protein S18 acetylase RimI-like enzyme